MRALVKIAAELAVYKPAQRQIVAGFRVQYSGFGS
jgi:hypothetical protein